MQTEVYAWLLKYILPYIRFNMYYTSMKGWKYKRGYDLLKPGDIILTRDDWKLISFLIPGTFSHAALCVDKDSEFEVAEMTHEGFCKSCFFDICKESDRVMIIRCKDWDGRYINKIIKKCKTLSGKLYDNQFKLGIKALYCSELVYVSDYQHRLKVDCSDLCGIGRPYVSPTDLYEAENIKIIWDSDCEIH